MDGINFTAVRLWRLWLYPRRDITDDEMQGRSRHDVMQVLQSTARSSLIFRLRVFWTRLEIGGQRHLACNFMTVFHVKNKSIFISVSCLSDVFAQVMKGTEIWMCIVSEAISVNKNSVCLLHDKLFTVCTGNIHPKSLRHDDKMVNDQLVVSSPTLTWDVMSVCCVRPVISFVRTRRIEFSALCLVCGNVVVLCLDLWSKTKHFLIFRWDRNFVKFCTKRYVMKEHVIALKSLGRSRERNRKRRLHVAWFLSNFLLNLSLFWALPIN